MVLGPTLPPKGFRAPEVEELISYDISGKSFNVQKAPTNYIPRESAEIRNVLEVLT